LFTQASILHIYITDQRKEIGTNPSRYFWISCFKPRGSREGVEGGGLRAYLKDGAQSLGGDCQGGSGSEDGAMVEMKQRPT